MTPNPFSRLSVRRTTLADATGLFTLRVRFCADLQRWQRRRGLLEGVEGHRRSSFKDKSGRLLGRGSSSLKAEKVHQTSDHQILVSKMIHTEQWVQSEGTKSWYLTATHVNRTDIKVVERFHVTIQDPKLSKLRRTFLSHDCIEPPPLLQNQGSSCPQIGRNTRTMEARSRRAITQQTRKRHQHSYVSNPRSCYTVLASTNVAQPWFLL